MDKKDAEFIGKQIKIFRKSAGLTQEQLAKKTAISLSAIGKYEIGERTPKYETLMEIAKALEIPITHLQGITAPTTDGGVVSFDIPDEIKKLYPPKKLTEEELNIKRIEYLKELHKKKFMDMYISNIYDRYEKNALTDKDIQDIDNYRKDEIENARWPYSTAAFHPYSYENEAYELFKKMLIAMGYDTKLIDTEGLFKMIKSQIEFTIYLGGCSKAKDKQHE